MVTERVRTLPTEPTDREIVKSHPLLSFITIGQRGRNSILPPNSEKKTKQKQKKSNTN